MYALLLLCAMMIDQEASPKTNAPENVSRRIPIVAGKHAAVADAIEALNLKGCGFRFDKEDDLHLLHLVATTEDTLDEVENTLEKLGLATPATTTRAFPLKHATAEIVTNSLQFKGIGRARVVPDARSNQVIVTGKRSDLQDIEARIAQLDQPQEPTPDENANWQERQIPLAAEKSKAEIDAIVKKLDTNDKLRCRLEKSGDKHMVVACSPLTKHLDAFETELREQGFAPKSDEVVTKSLNVETDLIADIQDELKPKLPGLQVERGDRHYTVRIHGKTADVAKAEKILADRGWLSSKQDTAQAPSEITKSFPLKHADAAKLASTLANAFREAKIGASVQNNSITASGNQKDVSAIEALIASLDQENTSQSPTKPAQTSAEAFESQFDNIVKIFNATTDNVNAMKSAFDLEPITVQIEPGETKGTIKLQGQRGDVNKAIVLLTERGFVIAAPEVKIFRLKYTTANDVAAKLEELGFTHVKIAPDVQTNSLAVSGAAKDIASIETLVGNLDQLAPGYDRILVPRGREKEMREVLNELGNPGVIVSSFPENRPFTIVGPRDAIGAISNSLDKRGLTDESAEGSANSSVDKQVKIFRLQHVICTEIAATLEKLGFNDLRIAADAQTNSIVITGLQKDIEVIEALIANLDQKGKPTEKLDAASDIRHYVYHLMNTPAEDAAAFLKRMKLEGASVTADVRTNSVIIQASPSDLKVIIRVISGLDMKDMSKDSSTSGPFPSPVIGTLWSDFAKAEAKTIATAGELRTAAAKLGNSHPNMIGLRKRLETEVKIAFDLRHKLQQAEAAQLRRQLTEIEARLKKREKNQAAIIQARIESLQKMDDLGWEAMTKPKSQNHETASKPRDIEKPSAEQVAANERARVWKRLDRDEYISTRTSNNFGGMGMGGMGMGLGGGFPMPPSTNPAPVQPLDNYQHGVLIGGNAMIRDSYGALNDDQVVWIGDKQLPCRMAAAAPFSIHAFRSSRFPSLGITDFTHEPTEGEQVWAFIPDRAETLVMGKAFRKAGPEFAIDEETSFGIEAEGKLLPGYIVCNDQGDFLGLVSYQNGSLGKCWNAMAISDWLQRTNMEAPVPEDPLTGRVIIALPGSAYLPVLPAVSEGGSPAVGYEPPVKRGRAFYGAVVKGVIVTHPEVSKSDLRNTGKILYGAGRPLTCEKMKLSPDGRFTLIWCKELTAKIGFTSAHKMVREKEFAIPLGTRAQGIGSFMEDNVEIHHLQPLRDEIDAFEPLRRSKSVVSQANDKGFEIEWLGSFNSIGLPVVTVGGHFLGVVDGDKDLDVKTDAQFQTAQQHHKVHAIPGEEIFRLVEEESKKLPAAITPEKPAEKPPEDPKTESPTPAAPE